MKVAAIFRKTRANRTSIAMRQRSQSATVVEIEAAIAEIVDHAVAGVLAVAAEVAVVGMADAADAEADVTAEVGAVVRVAAEVATKESRFLTWCRMTTD